MTDIKIEKRYDLQALVSEGLGDFNCSFNVSGGKIYSRSECQAKGVALVFWEDSGNLVIESLK